MNQERPSSSHSAEQGISNDLENILGQIRQDNEQAEADPTIPEQDQLEQTEKTSE